MISFLFTPIYMFILIFIVSFGTKKGSIASYNIFWYTCFIRSLQILRNISSLNLLRTKQFLIFTIYRFQHTAITARSTIYILILFWFIFFFVGESLLLVVLNFNTLIDVTISSIFSFSKAHIFFMTASSNSYLSDILFYFISLLASLAFLFLLNLRYIASYDYIFSSTICDLLGIIVISYLSYWWIFVFLIMSATFCCWTQRLQ